MYAVQPIVVTSYYKRWLMNVVRAVFGFINFRTSLASRATCLGQFWRFTNQTVRMKQAMRIKHLKSKIQGATTRVPPVLWPFHVYLAQMTPRTAGSVPIFTTKS